MQRMTRIGVASLLTLSLVVSFVSCADESELSAETERLAREEGAAATHALMGMLQANLVAAMQEGGPVHAVEFCAGQALALTDSVSRGLGEGITLKRVSNRHRNPVNAPDAEEVKALRHFETVLEESGSLPKDWVQQTPSGELRYYRPLVIAPPCLACHGDPAEMDTAVVDAIRQKYPEDEATGYTAGDLRGLIRVGISRDRIDLDSSG
ncbi:MAG: DUF3365 domain-containing protein [marine benthic group bacterium]|nr:DUF3365 domain-containing protein [Gemmatimonadota bacterium]MCL7974006.1 DUF3365 domain-containing protein [Gemmatimonadota bacterium]MCL7981052.1 DUF3365 domain-containing protein [Gemmatimonadota bacterium]